MTNDAESGSIPEKSGTPSSRPIIWVLDDSPLEAALAKRSLLPTYDVEVFAEGTSLLERLAAGLGPHVLVLDWQLPGMSGLEVCKFLRASRTESELPILMLTVYGHKADLVEGLNAGANDYLTKPYDAPELVARVNTLVRVKSLHERSRLEETRTVDLLARERNARADAEKANSAKDDFLAMVSHDLRTPLSAILGWARMIRGGGLTEEKVAKGMATIERNALAQAQLIDDLMDMSRILSGNMKLEREPVELVGLIKAALDAVRLTAEAKSITLEADVEPEAGRVFADASRLQQVVWNLLTNAIKFTSEGGRITVKVERADAAVRVSVVDTGRGIEKAFLPHVFERFRQGEVGPTRIHGGLGLGLAIVKHIVELHGGTVGATSEGTGRGATFLVDLPRIPDREMTERAAPVSLGSNKRELEGLRVLVVDDDAEGVELIAMFLQRRGAEVIATSSAAEAFVAIGERKPHVLVSDIGMPVEDGYTLMRRIRALPSDQGGQTPAIALTAFAGVHDRTRALSAGFNLYATKPVDAAELVVSIASLAGVLH